MYNNTNNGMYNGYEVETNKESFSETKSSVVGTTGSYMAGGTCSNMTMSSTSSMPGMVCAPIYECPQERVIHREFVHEVPHIMPINTRIVNHHIYKHSYSPCYTCCEENEICNVTDCCCNNF